jgi:hypothetical protein
MGEDQSVDKTGSEPVPMTTYIGVGCFTAFVGFWGGAMIAVFIGKIVGSARGCEPMEGTPACHWHLFALAGMIAGVVLLPTISIIRLKGRRSL